MQQVDQKDIQQDAENRMHLYQKLPQRQDQSEFGGNPETDQDAQRLRMLLDEHPALNVQSI